MGLVNTFCDGLSARAGMVVFGQYILRHFVLSLGYEVFAQHMLRYILRPRWYGRVLVNTGCDGLSVRAGPYICLDNISSDTFCVTVGI